MLSRLSASSSSAVTFRRVAIWSMKAPVPPAQEPFIRSSMPPSKKMIFASSPPSSTTAEASGSRVRTTSLVANTSWTKGTPAPSARPSPAEPEMAVRGRPPAMGAASASSSRIFCRTWEKWRWYFSYRICPSSTRTTLAVVEPMSMPRVRLSCCFI